MRYTEVMSVMPHIDSVPESFAANVSDSLAEFLQSSTSHPANFNILAIDLTAIAHNTRYFRKISEPAQLMAVLKADAYNHGAAIIAQTVIAAGAHAIGVTTIAEALELRKSGITAPILAWLIGLKDDFQSAIRADITLGISHPQQIVEIALAAQIVAKPAKVEIKLDTGLHRNGVDLVDWDNFITDLEQAITAQLIEIQGIFTHLVHGDQPTHSLNQEQKNLLLHYAQLLEKQGINPGIKHCANTGASLSLPETHCDRIRPGIGLYGYSPIPGDFPLRPAMQLSSKIVAIRNISAGEGVSYGHNWHSTSAGYVALIPIGYADGLLRNLSNKIYVRIGDHLYPQVGRICMDQCVVDLGNNPHGVKLDDEVILFGDGARGEMTVHDWANIAETIDYEIITLLRGRIHKVYH